MWSFIKHIVLEIKGNTSDAQEPPERLEVLGRAYYEGLKFRTLYVQNMYPC